MKFSLLCILLLALAGCRSRGFEGDRRQLVAKDMIRELNPQMHHFQVLGYKEDTRSTPYDSNLKRPIAYTIDFSYADSLNEEHTARGVVLFDPTGRAVLRSEIRENR